MHGDIVVFGAGKDVGVFRLPELIKVSEMKFKDYVGSVAISPCGKLVVVGLYDGNIEMRSLQDSDFKRTLVDEKFNVIRQAHFDMVHDLVFSPCGSRGDTYPLIISGSFDNTVKIWDSETGVRLSRIDCGGSVFDLALLPGGQNILVCTKNGVFVVGIDDMEKHEVQTEGKATGLASADEKVVVVHDDGLLQLRKAARLEHVVWSAQTNHTSYTSEVCISPDMTKIATTSSDRTSTIVSLATGEILGVIKGHTDNNSTARFTPDGSKLVTGSLDGNIKIWDLSQSLITLLISSSIRPTPKSRLSRKKAYLLIL